MFAHKWCHGLGRQSHWFCDDNTKALVIKCVTRGDGGQKLPKTAWRHLCTTFYQAMKNQSIQVVKQTSKKVIYLTYVFKIIQFLVNRYWKYNCLKSLSLSRQAWFIYRILLLPQLPHKMQLASKVTQNNHLDSFIKFKFNHYNITGGPRYSWGLGSEKGPRIPKPRIPSPIIT